MEVAAACISPHTQPGVQEQPPNTLRVAVFLILENLTGCDLQLHLEEQKKRLYGKLTDEKICFLLTTTYLLLPLRLDSLAVRRHHVSHVQPPQVLRCLQVRWDSRLLCKKCTYTHMCV